MHFCPESISSRTNGFNSNAGPFVERLPYLPLENIHTKQHKIAPTDHICRRRPPHGRQVLVCRCANRFLFTWILRYAHISTHECRGRVGGCVSLGVPCVICILGAAGRTAINWHHVGYLVPRFFSLHIRADHTWPNWIGDTGFSHRCQSAPRGRSARCVGCVFCVLNTDVD